LNVKMDQISSIYHWLLTLGALPLLIIAIIIIALLFKLARTFIKFAFTICALIILILVILKLVNNQ
jgi:hypothetical protein